ncbi:MAG: hypothetical protein LC135_10065 [Phycisphaerae bacterium]|nr:hypothetical protein [Phycisphaerae bacterium]MCZ2400192.1 hypothetical protein [Phycisphaerae bacterium]
MRARLLAGAALALSCTALSLGQSGLPVREVRPGQVHVRALRGEAAPRPAGPVGTRVYDTLGGQYHVVSTAPCTPRPNRCIDDGRFTPGPGQGGGPLSHVRVAVAILNDPNQPAQVDVDVELTFYDQVGVGDPNAPAGQFPLGGVVLALSGLEQGATWVMPAPVDVSFLEIAFPDDDWGVQVRLLRPGLQAPATYATLAFSQTPPSRGSSLDQLFLDTDCDNVIENFEIWSFGGPPLLANVALALYFPGGTDCIGDIDGDGGTCQGDLGILLSAYGKCEGEPGYVPAANISPGPVAACGGLEGIDQSDLGVLLADYNCGTCP